MNLAIVLHLALAAAVGADPSAEALRKASCRFDQLPGRSSPQGDAGSDSFRAVASPVQGNAGGAKGCQRRGPRHGGHGHRQPGREGCAGRCRAHRSSWARTRSRKRGRRLRRALGRIGKAVPTSRDAIKPLRRAAAEDADPVTRTVALGALAMMNEDVPGQVTALRKFLHHDEPLVRMKAAHALGMIGTAAKVAAPEIVEVLHKETDGHRRGYIARAGQHRRSEVAPGAGEGTQDRNRPDGAGRDAGRHPEAGRQTVAPGVHFGATRTAYGEDGIPLLILIDS